MVHGAGAGPQVHKDRRDWHNLKGMLPFLWEFRGRALFALSCLVLSCPVLSRLVLSCLVSSCPVLSCRVWLYFLY